MAPRSPFVPGRVPSQAYQDFVEGVRDYAICFLDPQGRIASWNAGALAMKGYRAEEVLGRPFGMFYLPQEAAAGRPEQDLLAAERDGRHEAEGWRVRKDGTRFWASRLLIALRDDDGTLLGYAKVTRDLTERRMAEEALRRSEERLQLMVHSVKDYAIFMLDPKGRIVTWNEGARRLKGYEEHEIAGQHFSIFYTPEDRARDHPAEELVAAIRDGRYGEEGWRVRKDGTRFWASVTITALFERDGTLRGFAKVTRDLTERKRAEDELRQRARDHAALNRELEAFTSAVAHDLRAPLRAMLSLSEDVLAREKGKLDESGVRSLDAIQTSAARLATLVEGLLELSRSTKGELHAEDVDVTALARAAWEDVTRQEPALHAELRVQEGLRARADPRLLRVLLDNLLGNAAKFSSRAAQPVVEVGVAQAGDGRAFFVRDNGIGFDPKRARGLFEPFQRLPGAAGFAGTGIGLATVRRIVLRHGGRIWAEAKEGAGATFWFTLPEG